MRQYWGFLVSCAVLCALLGGILSYAPHHTPLYTTIATVEVSSSSVESSLDALVAGELEAIRSEAFVQELITELAARHPRGLQEAILPSSLDIVSWAERSWYRLRQGTDNPYGVGLIDLRNAIDLRAGTASGTLQIKITTRSSILSEEIIAMLLERYQTDRIIRAERRARMYHASVFDQYVQAHVELELQTEQYKQAQEALEAYNPTVLAAIQVVIATLERQKKTAEEDIQALEAEIATYEKLIAQGDIDEFAEMAAQPALNRLAARALQDRGASAAFWSEAGLLLDRERDLLAREHGRLRALESSLGSQVQEYAAYQDQIETVAQSEADLERAQQMFWALEGDVDRAVAQLEASSADKTAGLRIQSVKTAVTALGFPVLGFAALCAAITALIGGLWIIECRP